MTPSRGITLPLPPGARRTGPAATAEQAKAARADPRRPHLIAAGPGTGKTFTMVERYRWLVGHERIPPERILAVTFTEAAAGELRERLERELGRPLDEAPISTFHGLCSRLLQDHAYEIGMPREVRVLDDVDQRLLLEGLRADLLSGAAGDLPADLAVLQPDDIDSLLRSGPGFALKLKGRGISPDDFIAITRRHHEHAWGPGATNPAAGAEWETARVLHAIYLAYQARLEALGRMDFDDLLLHVTLALASHPDFADACHRRFAQILVDEFQDTNRLQLELVRGLAAPGFGNVTAVGDAKQSIYGWRDADLDNVRTRFPGDRIPLTINRRSRQEILDLATDFIRRDEAFGEEPALTAERGTGGRCISLVMAPDADTEARRVVGEIGRLIRAGRPPGDIAILTSSVRRLPAAFENELRQQGIAYLTSAGSGFFDREEVKDMLALLRLVADPMDDGALVRMLQGPIVRLSDRTLYALAGRRLVRQGDRDSLYRERGVRLRDCVDRSRAEGWPELDERVARRLEQVLDALDRLGVESDTLTIAELLQRVLDDTGYLRHTQLRARREGARALRNLHKVIAMASRFESQRALAGIGDFVARVGEVMEAAVPVAEAEETAPDAVHLLTVHAAKGLEFGAVFLVNVERPRIRDREQLFFDPDRYGFLMKWWRNRIHARYEDHVPDAETGAKELGERRRVVYVALTRARDQLCVSATRPEPDPADIDVQADDHFAELLQWALVHPEAAQILSADQLDLPGAAPERTAPPLPGGADAIPRVLRQVERLRATAAPASAPAAGSTPRQAPVRLSFSQLHTLEICPVRYRFQEVWRVPEPPDELRWRAARTNGGAAELGSAVHEALATAHQLGGPPLDHYQGPAAGRDMLERYAAHPLAAAPTLGVEVEFNLLLENAADPAPAVRVRGLVDRVCEVDGRTMLVDYKTNARLDARLQAAYEHQLRIYGLAAARGLLPGGRDVALCLFDLRRGVAIDVRADPTDAERKVLAAGRAVAAGDFAFGPEHAARPCALCAYRPMCPDRLG
ncbi:MAG: ATP-dependent DNA helicase [Candidatus Dormiibacterota bacterium]